MSFSKEMLKGSYKSNKTQTTSKRKKKRSEDDILPIKPLVNTFSAPIKTRSRADDENATRMELINTKPKLFDDGYDVGDVSATILTTAGDSVLNVGKGVGRFAEGVGDAINYGVAGVVEKIGDKDLAEELKKQTQKSLVDDSTKKSTKFFNQYSVAGRTTDAILEGVGQASATMAMGGLGKVAGLGAKGVSALTTGATAVSGYGSGMSEAYQNGATDEEAVLYGVISGGAEALTEALFGGMGKGVNALGFSHGLSSADDMLAKKITERFSSQIAANFVEFGVKAGAEGVEEVLSGVAQAVGKKLTYMSEEDLLKILKDENLLEQFIVGTVTSGFMQSGVIPGTSQGSLKEAVQSGTDFISGLTSNEQAVVDKVYNDEITKAEKDGKKLNSKEKSKIYDEVLNNLEKGYIDIVTIESVLGGETYDRYKKTADREDALLKEFEELGNKTNATLKEQTRYKELSDLVGEFKSKSQRSQLKSQLSEEVFGLAKDSKLIESYNEKARRSQHFEADLSQYTEKQRETVKKAIDSGILNNTNRTREFVDMLAKISADKGVLFDFTNNEKLKNSSFAVEGKTVNGYKTDDGNVALNIDSAKSLNSVVGHEITHILEGTELYSTLQEVVKQYADTKGEYATRMQSLRELYTGVYKGEDFDARLQEELTADIVGDYLFTDSDFINNLSTEQPGLFKKMFDEVKYLCFLATAGSKEARALEKVKRAFEQAYKESGTAQKGIQYTIDNNQNLVYNDSRGEGYVRTDEFRNLQAESQRMSYEDTQAYWSGSRKIDDEVRGRLSRAFGLELRPTNSKRVLGVRTLLNPKTNNNVNIVEGVDASLFRDVFEISRKYLRNGELVDLHDIETTEDHGIGYKYCDNYLSEDGLSGFSITPDGDLISVFNLNTERGFLKTIAPIVKEKANTLDCYASQNQNLMVMYEKIFGFKTASVMDYNMKYDHDNIAENHNKPKVAFMVNTENDVEVRYFTKDEYDEAAAYRNSFINQADSKGSAFSNDENTKYSLSEQGSQPTKQGNYNVYGSDIAFTDDIAPVRKDVAPVKAVEAKKPVAESDIAPVKGTATKEATAEAKVAQILTKEPESNKRKRSAWSMFKTSFIDKASPFETLALKTGNREVDAKFNSIRYADRKAQNLIGKGAKGVKALNDIQAEVEKKGLTQSLYEYLYHRHNVDRMTLADRFEDVPNKAVFGDSVTARESQAIVSQYEKTQPKLKEYAQDIYNYNKYLRNLLVENGVISKETANLWEEMYPHYVPVRRADDGGLNIKVPLDSRRTGINAPVKKAKGGNTDILPLFDTMAQRTLQTYKAIAKNRFGVELKNTLGTTIKKAETSLDEVIDGIETHEDLLQKGKNGKNPTFTVFENGEKVTFEITDEMYDAMKPTSEKLAYTSKVANTISNATRGVLTEYNPTFMLTNAIKDAQDVLINSQHPLKTYKNFAKASKEIASKGKWYTEYMENGGEENTYFDKETNTFNKEKSELAKVIGFPLEKISEANNFIEKIPRLAEYIASREAGRSIDVSMLDAARVTTNFSAGGDVTKFLNRNGATFLNASVQGAAQQVRNVREAKANGIKGWIHLASKVALAGLPALFLNGLLWDDDEDYEELSDYVKQNYYVVAKFGDGKFVRIPKGRTMAVIQDAFTQVQNALTGDDEVDLQSFLDLAFTNLAPNNPIDNNIIAPIVQVKENKTWYGDDLVPTRLQDVPAAEQYDESTDIISKWLGEKLNYSPYKINYLLNQYSGGVGDILLPMATPKAESEGGIPFIAPLRDKFTTDSVLKNQNTTDFYNVRDELTVNANSINATDEDVLKSKYFNSVGTEIGELYKEKREIQNSDLSDELKFKQVRDIQKQINEITEDALNTYENVKINGKYANIGDKHYRLDDEGKWQKITDEQLEKQNEVIGILGITPSQYWSNKAEYDMKAFYPEKYAILQEQGISVEDYKENYEEMSHRYTDDFSWASDNPEKYTLSKAITSDVMEYRQYTSDLGSLEADKDSNGKSMNGSLKAKKKAYIWGLDIDDGAKYILFKSQYNADDTYNREIVVYLDNKRKNAEITWPEMVTILEELDFKVESNGRIRW